MGYNTKYIGELKIENELTIKQLKLLKRVLDRISNIDLELTEDMDGLVHNGAEKSYDLDNQINSIVEEMKREFSDFKISGEIEAIEDFGHRYKIVMENNKALIRSI